MPEPGSGSLLSGLGGELRHTLRLLRRAPAFTVAVVAVLALGIGATTAAFELVYSALLAPLPYTDADRLVMVWEHNLTRGRARNVINPGNYFAWSERSTSLETTGIFGQTDRQPVGRRRSPRGAARPGGAAASARRCSGRARWPAGCWSKATMPRARRRPSSSARGCGDGATVGRPTPSAAPW